MSFLLRKLETKKDIDLAIKTTIDKVLVLRFGRESDAVCLQIDDVVKNLTINNPTVLCSLDEFYLFNRCW